MRTLLLLALTATPSLAQLPGEHWIACGEYADIDLYSRSWVWLNTVGGGSGGMSVDAQGVLFRSYGATGLSRYDYSPGAGFTQAELMQPWFGPYVTPGGVLGCMAALRDGVWMLNGWDLVRADKIGLNQNPPILLPLATLLGVPRIRSACTDGREIFFHLWPDAANPDRICAVDIRRPAMPIRTVATLTADAGRLELLRDGDILFGSRPDLWRLDPITGAITPAGVSWPPGPAFQSGFVSFAYDPWSDVLAAVGSWQRGIAYRPFTGGTWNQRSTLWNQTNIVSTSERPFELFGAGCDNGTGRDPRMRWRGMPFLGQGFTLTLHDAEPGIAFFWLGLSDTFWAPVGALPFDAAVYGAPGCRILVAADVPYLVGADAAGRAFLDLAIPVDPALSGFQVLAQTASTSTANALGLATSDALAIRMR